MEAGLPAFKLYIYKSGKQHGFHGNRSELANLGGKSKSKKAKTDKKKEISRIGGP